MRRTLLALTLLLPALPFLLLPVSAEAPSSPLPALSHWRAREDGFTAWEHHGTEVAADGTVRLAAAGEAQRADGLTVGETFSPIVEGVPFEEAIASWNVDTPVATWIDVLLAVRIQGEWTDPFLIATWTARSDGAVRRQSYPDPGHPDVRIAVDTLVMRRDEAEAAQLTLRLFSEQPGVSPVVRAASVARSAHPQANPTLSTGDPTRWNRDLGVPACSQMVYPDGGEVWCSPTSVAMALRYWQAQQGQPVAACEPTVRQAVDGVYDWLYNGHGNWPFNVAYAATQGLEGYVTRLRSLDEAEGWIARGVPLVVSYSWGPGELDGAPLPSSAGHLAVLGGFDADGDPILYDPAAPSDATVRRVYRRDQWERLWLSRTAGTVYVLAPPDEFDMPLRLYLPMVTGGE